VGGSVGGGVAGCVIGGSVGKSISPPPWSGSSVVGQPTPTEAQQNSCFAEGQSETIPSSQLYIVVVVPEKSQHNKGIQHRRLSRQHVVIRQVKSLLGLSKSPPHPTYL